MGYQALLFCPDEKLSRIVGQVFSDLEFNVESVQEPFSAVKKLMAQRYDALVVDCENESNASLLFKSARNSNFNQGTLAIAVVEGQAGVAKAYRIGANLVLTKPINVEQAKGTLRVARGLLRKNSEGTATAHTGSGPSAPSPVKAAPAAPAIPAVSAREAIAQVSPTLAPTTPANIAHAVPEPEPVMPASANTAENPVPPVPAHATPAIAAEVAAPIISSEAKEAVAPAAVATSLSSAMATAKAAAAAAPAKVKDYSTEEKTSAKIDTVDPILKAMEEEESGTVGSTPSFSALELDHSGKQGGSKKILIAAVVLVAAAALGYFGWTWMSQRKATPSPTPVSVVQPSSEATPSISTPAPVPSAPSPAVSQPAATAPMPASPAPAKAEKSAPIPRIEINPEPETKAPAVAPLVVKSKPAKQKKVAADDTSAPLPNPLAVADTNPNTLDSLVASSAAKPQQPTLATLNISQGVSQGLLIKRVEPKYPPLAQAMHVQGAVILDATISREGNIANLKLVKGDQVLSRAAIDAVRQWRYKPYYLDGKPVEVQTQITINFKLPN